MEKQICKAPWCRNNAKTSGYCGKHYSQILRNGKLLTRTRFDKNEYVVHDNYIEVYLYNRSGDIVGSTYIDAEDKWVLKHKWCLMKNGYVSAMVSKKRTYLHILVMNAIKEIDHVDRNPLNNRKSNLRLCSSSQNNYNRPRYKTNKSGYSGVYWKKDRNKWTAYINVEGKRIHLGHFSCRKKAINARIQAEHLYYREFSPYYSSVSTISISSCPVEIE